MSEPIAAPPAAADARLSALTRVAPYLWPSGPGAGAMRARVVIALLFLIAAKLAAVATPFFYKYAVDALTVDGLEAGRALIAAPIGLIVAYGVARAFSQIFAQARDAVFAKVGQRALRRLALETFEHVHALSLRFHLERRMGALNRVIERGVKGVDFLLRMALFNILPVIVELLLVACVLWAAFDWRFVAAAVVTVAAYVAFTFAITEWRIRVRKVMNDADQEANAKAVDSLINYETVKYFGAEAMEAKRYDASMAGYERAAIKAQQSLAILNVGQGVIIAGGLVAMMAMAAQGVVAGVMTVGDLVMVNAYLIQLALPLNLLGMVYREVKQSLLDMGDMFRLMDSEVEVRDAPGATPLAIAGGAVAFERVSFRYDAARPILNDVSFTVPAGRTLAIVGPSGAGKSTIGRLLFRFYDVSDGTIRIDGRDIREATQASLRQAIAVVPQDTVLFNDAIGYNIAYGRSGAGPEEIRAAARSAQIDGFIERLPEGYGTMVGERGLKLSGGEKQRVAIARALIKNPPILILDEATSALDSETEREIQGALSNAARGRTTLIIAHRLSTVIDADEIIVLEAGEVVERGRHGDLVAAGGRYAAMWARQQEAANG